MLSSLKSLVLCFYGAKSTTYFAIAISILVAAPVSAQNLLANGSFEDGSFPGGNILTLNTGATNITGWTVIVDNVQWHDLNNSSGVSASEGGRFIDLTGVGDSQPHGGVQQTVSLVAGNTYRLSFDLGYDQRYPTSPDAITAFITGVPSQTFTYSGATNLNNSWQNFFFDFTATSSSTTIALQGSSTSSGSYIGLDNARLVLTATGVTAPEPGTLTLLGCGLIGGITFCRRRLSRL